MKLWFKTSTATSGPLVQYMESGVNGKGAKITISGGVLSASGLNGSGTASLTGTTSVDDDNWHHVALTGHDTDFKLYLDGELEDSETIASGNFTGMTETFYVAGDGINGFFNGCMKEVSFWDAEKSSTDIWADFSGETEFSGSESGLIGYWKLDEGTGTTADDETSNNRDLTLNNTPTWTDGEYVDYNTADVIAFNDFYPFGQILDSRYSNSDSYRYSFNGMEKDDEVKGSGNSYDFGARIYDPRIGRFLSKDPVKKHNESPYVAFSNNPIWFVDIAGKDTLKAKQPSTSADMDALLEHGKKMALVNKTAKEIENKIYLSLFPAEAAETDNHITRAKKQGRIDAISMAYDISVSVKENDDGDLEVVSISISIVEDYDFLNAVSAVEKLKKGLTEEGKKYVKSKAKKGAQKLLAKKVGRTTAKGIMKTADLLTPRKVYGGATEPPDVHTGRLAKEMRADAYERGFDEVILKLEERFKASDSAGSDTPMLKKTVRDNTNVNIKKP